MSKITRKPSFGVVVKRDGSGFLYTPENTRKHINNLLLTDKPTSEIFNISDKKNSLGGSRLS